MGGGLSGFGIGILGGSRDMGRGFKSRALSCKGRDMLRGVPIAWRLWFCRVFTLQAQSAACPTSGSPVTA